MAVIEASARPAASKRPVTVRAARGTAAKKKKVKTLAFETDIPSKRTTNATYLSINR